jgi:hypothetical protein
MCSKKCAKPVLPGFSRLEPTWTRIEIATIGSDRSSCRITSRPFSRVYLSKGISSFASGAGAAQPTSRTSVAAKATRARRKSIGGILRRGAPLTTPPDPVKRRKTLW